MICIPRQYPFCWYRTQIILRTTTRQSAQRWSWGFSWCKLIPRYSLLRGVNSLCTVLQRHYFYFQTRNEQHGEKRDKRWKSECKNYDLFYFSSKVWKESCFLFRISNWRNPTVACYYFVAITQALPKFGLHPLNIQEALMILNHCFWMI